MRKTESHLNYPSDMPGNGQRLDSESDQLFPESNFKDFNTIASDAKYLIFSDSRTVIVNMLYRKIIL